MATLYEDDGHVLSGAQCDREGVQHTGRVGLGGERSPPVKICVYFTGLGAWGRGVRVSAWRKKIGVGGGWWR